MKFKSNKFLAVIGLLRLVLREKVVKFEQNQLVFVTGGRYVPPHLRSMNMPNLSQPPPGHPNVQMPPQGKNNFLLFL